MKVYSVLNICCTALASLILKIAAVGVFLQRSVLQNLYIPPISIIFLLCHRSHCFFISSSTFLRSASCILRFPSEKLLSVNKQQKMYENKSWTVQEVHDGKAFERGVSYAPFPLQFSDPPGTISRAIQTLRVPAPPIAPRTSSMPEDQSPG